MRDELQRPRSSWAKPFVAIIIAFLILAGILFAANYYLPQFQWQQWGSSFLKICLGVLLLGLTAFLGYTCAVLGGVRDMFGRILISIDSTNNTLKSVENLVDKEVGALLGSVNQTIAEVNAELPQLLENINGITGSVQQISENEIQPMIHSIQEMTETFNQNVVKLDQLVNGLSQFSEQTVKRAEFYRDELSVPLTDIISVWSAMKTGLEVFKRSRPKKASKPEDAS